MTKARRRLLRADLHVHTRHSSLGAFHFLGARDCYSDPAKVYRRARAAGMDLVTFTDHDTIDGCLELLSKTGDLPDFFISEEVSVRDPDTGTRLHVSAYGIDEAKHREIQRRRSDARDLLGYLNAEGIPSSLNHIGSSLVGRRIDPDRLAGLLECFPLLETQNGAQFPDSNGLAKAFLQFLAGRGHRPGVTGGSDAHTLRRIGTAWTAAEAACRDSFLEALRRRETRVGGVSIRLPGMIRDVYGVVFDYYSDVVRNRKGHFTRVARGRAAACSVASLPLHLVALPATGTVYRYVRVRRKARSLAREIEKMASSVGRLRSAGESTVLPRRASRATLEETRGLAWVPQPGSEEA